MAKKKGSRPAKNPQPTQKFRGPITVGQLSNVLGACGNPNALVVISDRNGHDPELLTKAMFTYNKGKLEEVVLFGDFIWNPDEDDEEGADGDDPTACHSAVSDGPACSVRDAVVQTLRGEKPPSEPYDCMELGPAIIYAPEKAAEEVPNDTPSA